MKEKKKRGKELQEKLSEKENREEKCEGNEQKRKKQKV